jgi:hypothetical protein
VFGLHGGSLNLVLDLINALHGLPPSALQFSQKASRPRPDWGGRFGRHAFVCAEPIGSNKAGARPQSRRSER